MRGVGLLRFITDWNLQIFLYHCHNPSNFPGLAKSSQSPHLRRPWGSRRIRNYGRLTFYCSVDVRATVPLLPPSDQIHATVRSDQIWSDKIQIRSDQRHQIGLLGKTEDQSCWCHWHWQGLRWEPPEKFSLKESPNKIRGLKNKKLDYQPKKKSWHLANLGNWNPIMIQFSGTHRKWPTFSVKTTKQKAPAHLVIWVKKTNCKDLTIVDQPTMKTTRKRKRRARDNDWNKFDSENMLWIRA